MLGITMVTNDVLQNNDDKMTKLMRFKVKCEIGKEYVITVSRLSVPSDRKTKKLVNKLIEESL